MPEPKITLQLPASVTHEQAQDVLKELKDMICIHKKRVCVDASRLKQFDSSAIALLLELKRVSMQHKLEWQILEAPEELLTLTALYDMQGLLELASAQ